MSLAGQISLLATHIAADLSKTKVKCATTAAITLSGTQTIDGVAVAVGDRVLVKDQSPATGNGVYTAATGAWSRTVGLDTAALVAGYDLITVLYGTVNGGTVWTTSFKASDILGAGGMNVPYLRIVDTSQVAVGSSVMPPPLVSRLGAAVNNSTTTFASTGLSVNVATGKNYHIHARGQYSSASTAAGMGMNLAGTCTATAIRAELTVKGLTATTNGERSLNTLAQNTASNATTFATATDYHWEIVGVIRVNQGGTLLVNFRSSSTTVITVEPESSLYVQEIP